MYRSRWFQPVVYLAVIAYEHVPLEYVTWTTGLQTRWVQLPIKSFKEIYHHQWLNVTDCEMHSKVSMSLCQHCRWHTLSYKNGYTAFEVCKQAPSHCVVTTWLRTCSLWNSHYHLDMWLCQIQHSTFEFTNSSTFFCVTCWKIIYLHVDKCISGLTIYLEPGFEQTWGLSHCSSVLLPAIGTVTHTYQTRVNMCSWF